MTATLDGTRTWAVGDRLAAMRIERISRTTLALFAGGSGDHNPIHVDLDVAHEAGLDDVFAHGMLGMAHLGRLLTDHFPQHLLRSFTTRFVAVTPVNAEPSCFGEVVAVEDGLLTLDLRVELPDGTVTLTGRATLTVSEGHQL